VLAALDDLGLTMVEQPYPADDLVGSARLQARLRTPVCLDESVTSLGALQSAVALGAGRVVNLKPGRLGGVLETVRVHDACVQAGIPVWIGGMLETGIGRAVNVALATLPGVRMPGDTSASDRYFAADLTAPFVLDADGLMAVPAGPGIGVTPDPDRLADVTRHTERIVG
jgi:O-succinylbenzoate synthase